MPNPLGFDALVQSFHAQLDLLPDRRRGKNTQYSIKDAALAAFAVFFTQSPSFLAHQQALLHVKGRSNAQTLVGISSIPCDNQIRTLLEPVPPSSLFPIFSSIIHALTQAGVVATFRTFGNTLLIALDGTRYFSSQHISCSSCSRTTATSGSTTFSHCMITPVIVAPGTSEVLSLEPEFITPQDGHENQDCEQEAAKGWVGTQAPKLPFSNVTVLGDDLFCHYPFCSLLLEQGWNFILVCKPASHAKVYSWIDYLSRVEQLGEMKKRHWTGKFGEVWTYRFASGLPVRGEQPSLRVNWCELTIRHETSGKQLDHNAFATMHAVTAETVAEVVAAGRARWKVENENTNVLKTKGYHLEHNFGHGKQNLAAVVVTLTLLAFLFHTVLELLDRKYQVLRAALGARETFFGDIRPLTRYFVFERWEELLSFMLEPLELQPPPNST